MPRKKKEKHDVLVQPGNKRVRANMSRCMLLGKEKKKNDRRREIVRWTYKEIKE
jgi:hypothetical protein